MRASLRVHHRPETPSTITLKQASTIAEIHIKAFETLNGLREGRLLAACTGVVEKLLADHYKLMEDFTGNLARTGELETRKLNQFLRPIKRKKLGNAVLAALNHFAIDEEADRVHRMFFGS